MVFIRFNFLSQPFNLPRSSVSTRPRAPDCAYIPHVQYLHRTPVQYFLVRSSGSHILVISHRGSVKYPVWWTVKTAHFDQEWAKFSFSSPSQASHCSLLGRWYKRKRAFTIGPSIPNSVEKHCERRELPSILYKSFQQLFFPFTAMIPILEDFYRHAREAQ